MRTRTLNMIRTRYMHHAERRIQVNDTNCTSRYCEVSWRRRYRGFPFAVQVCPLQSPFWSTWDFCRTLGMYTTAYPILRIRCWYNSHTAIFTISQLYRLKSIKNPFHYLSRGSMDIMPSRVASSCRSRRRFNRLVFTAKMLVQGPLLRHSFLVYLTLSLRNWKQMNQPRTPKITLEFWIYVAVQVWNYVPSQTRYTRSRRMVILLVWIFLKLECMFVNESCTNIKFSICLLSLWAKWKKPMTLYVQWA